MITSGISLAFVLALASLSTFADAKVEESFEMKIFDSDYRPSKDQMLALLKKADLVGHGYNKDITTNLANVAGSDRRILRTTHFYYKAVKCSRIREVVQELQNLIPGLIRMDLAVIFNREIKTRKMTNMKYCQVGVEVHFHEGCTGKNKSTRRQKRHQGHDCDGCNNCVVIKQCGNNPCV